MTISYAGDVPMNDHRTPMGEELPYGWRSRVR